MNVTQVSRGLVIGGALQQTNGAPHTTVNGPVYINGAWTGSFTFNAGVFPGTPVWQALFPWDLYEVRTYAPCVFVDVRVGVFVEEHV
jgi:hypothetical protein